MLFFLHSVCLLATGINKLIEDMDDSLNVKYDAFFESFLNTAKEFLGMGELKVKSNLKARTHYHLSRRTYNEYSQMDDLQQCVGNVSLL